MLRRFHEWPSPARMHRQGWLLCFASRLHIRILVSSEAEAMICGLTGDVTKSLTSFAGGELIGLKVSH